MKLIIAGSRTFDISAGMLTEILSGFDLVPNEIVCGMCEGVDKSGYDWAKCFQRDIKEFPADWKKYDNKAGPIRNREMAQYADSLLLIWDGESKGSLNMKIEMMVEGKPIYEVILRKHNV